MARLPCLAWSVTTPGRLLLFLLLRLVYRLCLLGFLLLWLSPERRSSTNDEYVGYWKLVFGYWRCLLAYAIKVALASFIGAHENNIIKLPVLHFSTLLINIAYLLTIRRHLCRLHIHGHLSSHFINCPLGSFIGLLLFRLNCHIGFPRYLRCYYVFICHSFLHILVRFSLSTTILSQRIPFITIHFSITLIH